MSRYLTLSNPSGISGANLKRRIGAIMGGQPLHRLDHAKKVLLGACGIAALAAPLALGLAASPLSVLAQAPAPGHNVTVTALGAPTQAKVAAAPPILSVKPGSGGEPADSSRELALAAAIASQDERDIVRYGGTAQQVATAILSHTKTNPPMDASTARFIFQDGILRVVMSSSDGRSRLHQPLGDVTPPGGVADLPTTADEAGLISIESAFGPPQARAPSASDPGRLMPTIPTKAP